MWLSRRTFLTWSVEVKLSDSCFYRIILATLLRIDGRRSRAEAGGPVREPLQKSAEEVMVIHTRS